MAKGDRVVLSQALYSVGQRDIAAMPARVEREVQDALARLGAETRDMARSYCPRKTGALSASIYSTRGAGVENSGGPFTRQSTEGYFRAINASIRRNAKLEMLDQELVHLCTQRPIKGAILMRTIDVATGGERGQRGLTHSMASNLDLYYKVNRGISNVGGSTFASFSGGGGDEGGLDIEHLVPSITEMGTAGRQSFFVTVGAAAHYAGDVEFGHVVVLRGKVVGHVGATPFMRPALAWAKSQLNERVTAAFKRGLLK